MTDDRSTHLESIAEETHRPLYAITSGDWEQMLYRPTTFCGEYSIEPKLGTPYYY